MLSRDYLTLKIWDLAMESKPIQTIPIHEHLRTKLCDLYENDCIFDKFECTFSGNGSHVLTASYNNFFHIWDVGTRNDVILQADKSAFKAKRAGSTKNKVSGPGGAGATRQGKKEEYANLDTLDFHKKILHASWHPKV